MYCFIVTVHLGPNGNLQEFQSFNVIENFENLKKTWKLQSDCL